jgi:hypothetical protein
MNLSKINQFMMQKKMSFLVSEEDYSLEPVNPNIVFGALANLETWNTTVSTELMENLLKVSEDDFINKYYNPLVDILKSMKGDDVSHDHFVFQNFPDSCRELTSNQLSEMRFLRYHTVLIDDLFGTDFTSEIMDGTKPEYIERPDAKISDLDVVKLASMEDFYALNRNLIGSKSALSELDRQIIDFAINEKSIPTESIIPAEIPYKETMALILKYDMEKNLHLNLPFDSYVDFKRALAVLSEQDPSQKKINLRKFTTQEKKYLLKKLNESYDKNPKLIKDQMYKDREFISRLGSYWKIGRYKEYCPEINNIVSKIQNNDFHVYTEARKKEEAILDKDAIALSDLLKSQPGEYFRRFYFMIEHAKDTKELDLVLNRAEKLANKVPNNILLSANATISAAERPTIVKTAFPHGDTRCALQYESYKKPLDKSIIDRVDHICKAAMIERLSKKLDFKNEKIYISEDMKLCPVPFGVKDESGGSRTLTKGTYMDIEPKESTLNDILAGNNSDDILRLFVYKQIPQGGFVDLSASFLNKNCELVEQCSWTNLKTSNDGRPLAIHSGDGHDCQKGLSEFIDIDLNVMKDYAKEHDVSYIAVQIHSWNSIPFKKMEKCFAGIMRTNDMIKHRVDESERYKIFDPKIVKCKMDLVGNEVSCIPFVYDVERSKCIVTDIALGRHGYESKGYEKGDVEHEVALSEKLKSYAAKYKISLQAISDYPTLESCNDLVTNITRNIVNNNYPNLYDLYHMAAVAGNAKAENFTDNEKEATISFAWEGTITPYDRDVITKTFMTLEKEYENKENAFTKEELENKFNLCEELMTRGKEVTILKSEKSER